MVLGKSKRKDLLHLIANLAHYNNKFGYKSEIGLLGEKISVGSVVNNEIFPIHGSIRLSLKDSLTYLYWLI